ncbi:MAG: DUF2336 domain-containing protein [Proteobacteria bacterium]|nr:DUF2336 domain-containing protein [Pseudomonadota bacterium]
MALDRRKTDTMPAALSRADTLRILEERNNEAREELAARGDAAPEVLFFLASEGSIAARRAIARNAAAPAHANRLLAEDNDKEVRVELARKIGRLIPNLPPDTSEKMQALTIETLERLAHDQLPRVRRILAEEIKALDCVPKRVIDMLARDVDEVAAPILEYSPLLSDADLIDIISSAQARFTLTAIAARKPLSANVSDAIATALDVPAVAALLANSTAEIREQTLEKIIDHGSRITEWHLPLVLRNDLSQRAIRRIAGFVSAALLDKLSVRESLDPETRSMLAKRVRVRIDEPDDESTDPGAQAQNDVALLHKEGRLDDFAVERAAEAGKREFVIAALALLTRTPVETVRRIIQSGTAKPAIALVWRAKLSMRVAFKVQTLVMRLKGGELLPARDGVDFPLTEDEMLWHLNYFGIAA